MTSIPGDKREKVQNESEIRQMRKREVFAAPNSFADSRGPLSLRQILLDSACH